ncbi:hypothetical protein AJ85_04575 [Alkalihalobacillus alcalophilus ATCC 27647 = CGMCC 1.3604]|uniref:Nucleotidyltransferase family protein n=1 Tax=Alkalihalobacillus alcalophilus ATCC 27647 = CGMCC 1.3604 TaxID=1218173 RepID=A0A094YWH3_ALKAL|nr:nucleotidyltransferase family protein [Alkalihalobacillus alcalophilus]KGA97872.1 hypothetical protein BALCAV_0207495 [Alkalihalobacillus alcalophilus ATCC 27647 = CGMCC 1.3604]MED1562118.1 nucleotidyltransferase family protein [Alkalihalobacillus alcalophilus]THG91496.1 hypothetical protein AJ85_04575 [Alkalihalobacillus alcalophilus ATCC 27647 = CGMCC 1.3604]
MLNSESDVLNLIRKDKEMMEIIRIVASLQDWWVCAGFVRTKVWDTLHQFPEKTSMSDIDVIYFDPHKTSEQIEKEWEQKLIEIQPHTPWSVKNQARMHVINGLPPYQSSEDAISKFPETATALGVKLNEKGELQLTCPCGLDDLLNLAIKPTPHFLENKSLHKIYQKRMNEKCWKSKWPLITVDPLS